MRIRTANLSDLGAIRRIHLKAFDSEEREQVADLAKELLRETSVPETIHLVAESDGALVGHVAFSPVRSVEEGDLIGYILAPLAVVPERSGEGIGTALVKEGLERMERGDAKVVLVYGDPAYYARFGFRADLAGKFLPPFSLGYPSGWQACVLIEGTVGEGPVSIACVEALSRPELW